MLKEIDNPRQTEGEPLRRWFEDTESDLIVWEEDSGIVGFQFCYGKGQDEYALTWKREAGFVQERVDDGESRQLHYKSTPILAEDCDIDINAVEKEFLRRSEEIDPEIKSFVLEKFASYAAKGAGI